MGDYGERERERENRFRGRKGVLKGDDNGISERDLRLKLKLKLSKQQPLFLSFNAVFRSMLICEVWSSIVCRL